MGGGSLQLTILNAFSATNTGRTPTNTHDQEDCSRHGV